MISNVYHWDIRDKRSQPALLMSDTKTTIGCGDNDNIHSAYDDTLESKWTILKYEKSVESTRRDVIDLPAYTKKGYIAYTDQNDCKIK